MRVSDMKKVLIAGMALMALGSGAVAATDLVNADVPRAIETYKQNEMRFQRDFVGKTIEFEWMFQGASKQLFGNGYIVSFGTGGLFGGVDCNVEDQKILDTIIEWNKGQRAAVTGVIDDVMFGTLSVRPESS
jgi:hypothetical protein